MTKECRYKTKFRQSSRWKNFRKRMRHDRKIDEITGSPLYAGWQLHHCNLDVEHYSELNAANFICCNRKTHEIIHWLFRYTNWRDVLDNLATVMELMEKLNK